MTDQTQVDGYTELEESVTLRQHFLQVIRQQYQQQPEFMLIHRTLTVLITRFGFRQLIQYKR